MARIATRATTVSGVLIVVYEVGGDHGDHWEIEINGSFFKSFRDKMEMFDAYEDLGWRDRIEKVAGFGIAETLKAYDAMRKYRILTPAS